MVASGFWQVIHISFMISLLGGIFALTGFLIWYLIQGGGVAGLWGYVLATASLVFIFGLDYSEVFIFPTLAVEFHETVVKYGDGTSMPSVAFAFPLSGLMFLVGYVLFSYHLIKTKCITPNSGRLLIVGTVIFAVGLSGILPMLVVQVGAVFFGAGLIWTGLSLRQNVSGQLAD